MTTGVPLENNENCPMISFVIATKNCAKELSETLRSFKNSCITDYEIHIQDGISVDATVQEAKAYSNDLPIFVCSEKDTGIYDAWNKAIHKIRGQWVLFMGAGDTLCNFDCLKTLSQDLSSIPQNVQYYSVPVILVFPPNEDVELLKPDVNPVKGLLNGMCLPHQGLFHRRNLFEGRQFDSNFRIAGDYDFVCRTITAHNLQIGEAPLVRMVFGGISSSLDHMVLREKEFFSISRVSYPTQIPWKMIARLMKWSVIFCIKSIAGRSVACFVADITRRIQGKPLLWSRQVPCGLHPCLSNPSMDLLIATIGRKAELDRLLTSLEAQTCKNFRILLADQNPSGFLDEILARHSDLPITRIMLPPHGVSVARNVLLDQAKADIIVFPDDDCWYAPDTLERVCETFAAYPSCGALLGVWTPSPDTQTRGMSEGVVSRAGLFQLAGTCVQFYRREAVTGLRFDPVLGPGTGLPYGCGEDTDYLLYAHARTEVRRYAKIRVFHPSPKENQPSPQKVASYAAGRMYLLKKHGFSRLFMLFNVLYPLCIAPLDALRYGKAQGIYRLRMFFERLRNWF